MDFLLTQTCRPLDVNSMLQPMDHVIRYQLNELFTHTVIELNDGVACCGTAIVIGLSVVEWDDLLTTLLVSF